MSISILIYISIGLLVLALIWMLRFETRMRKLLAGTKARNLEEVMDILGKRIEKMEDNQGKIIGHLEIVDDRLNKSIRNIETIRFNPFEDAGSNQSFAIAMMNDEGDGVVLSSLYARDRMSIFAKPIKKGKSDFDLTDEEREVLNKVK